MPQQSKVDCKPEQSKPTAGPWRIGTAGAIVADHNEGLPMEASCREFYGGNIFICESVTGANARLIAAAPQLLEALEHISSLWPEPPNCADVLAVHGINDGKARAIALDAALNIAREAICSAKGETL